MVPCTDSAISLVLWCQPGHLPWADLLLWELVKYSSWAQDPTCSGAYRSVSEWTLSKQMGQRVERQWKKHAFCLPRLLLQKPTHAFPMDVLKTGIWKVEDASQVTEEGQVNPMSTNPLQHPTSSLHRTLPKQSLKWGYRQEVVIHFQRDLKVSDICKA